MNLADFGLVEKNAVAIIKIHPTHYELANDKELDSEKLGNTGIVSFGKSFGTLEDFKRTVTEYYGITKFEVIEVE